VQINKQLILRRAVKDYFGFIKQLTLGKLLVSLSIFSVALAFVLILVFADVVRDNAVQDFALADARQTSQLVFESLYSAMRKGWNKQEIRDDIWRLNKAMPGLRINVYRGKIVERQFGAMAGESTVIASDPMLAKALDDGKDALLIAASGKSIRYLYPVLASRECLDCHTSSFEGAVHGVIDITYPIDELKVSFAYVVNSIVAYTLLILAAVFAVLFLKFRSLVAMPVASLVNLVQKLNREMNLSPRVSKRHWISELPHLPDYLNRLLNTVNEYNSRLEKLSVRDPLTNLYNRRKFNEFMQHGNSPGDASSAGILGDHDRPGQLQIHQRHIRSSGRRHGAQGICRDACRRVAHRRCAGAYRQRRIRHHLARNRCRQRFSGRQQIASDPGRKGVRIAGRQDTQYRQFQCGEFPGGWQHRRSDIRGYGRGFVQGQDSRQEPGDDCGVGGRSQHDSGLQARRFFTQGDA